MKKFLILFLLCTLSVMVNATTNNTKKNSPTLNKQNFKVEVTYAIYHSYYDEKTHQLIEQILKGSKTEPFYIYAETATEAEDLAIAECSTVCHRHERQIGKTTYRNTKCDVYETRRVQYAKVIKN